MKKWKVELLIVCFLIQIQINCFGQLIGKRCATAEIETFKSKKNNNYAKARVAFNTAVNNCMAQNIANGARLSGIEELLRIPVVVHVVHNSTSSTIGGARNSNISDEQIKSQIEVLNEDYRRKPNTLGFNSNPIGADMNIEFYLADTDPDGKVSTGINRIFSDRNSYDPFSDADQLSLSNLSYWPSDCYLNIWVVTLANNYLGFSQFPVAADFDGLDSLDAVNEKLDGLYIDYRYFGRKSTAITSKYYKFGRTATHEIGHWLGLIHTWGDAVCGTDYVDDTPTCTDANLTVFCNDIYSNCNGVRTKNMIENYMDYTIDSCMNTFTMGQLARVKAVFEVSPRRKKLIECAARLPESDFIDIQVYPNPAVDYIKGNLLFKGQSDAEIALFDLNGVEIDRQTFLKKRSFKFSYQITKIPKGIYILYATANGQKVSKRILVSN